MANTIETIPNGGPDRTVTDSPERIIEALMRIHSMRMEVCLPAIVKDYNRNSHLALVQPLTNMVSSSGEQLERSDIIVPVRRIQHGAFLIDFPLYKGDTGWLIAADRDSETSLLANSSEVTSDSNPNKGGQRPSTGILHKYRFGFFIPDRWGDIHLENSTEENEQDDPPEDFTDLAVIRSQNGKTKIIMSHDGDIEIVLSDNKNLTITSDVTINGALTVRDSAQSTDAVSMSGGNVIATTVSADSVSASGIDLATHYHKDSWGQDTTMPTS